MRDGRLTAPDGLMSRFVNRSRASHAPGGVPDAGRRGACGGCAGSRRAPATPAAPGGGTTRGVSRGHGLAHVRPRVHVPHVYGGAR